MCTFPPGKKYCSPGCSPWAVRSEASDSRLHKGSAWRKMHTGQAAERGSSWLPALFLLLGKAPFFPAVAMFYKTNLHSIAASRLNIKNQVLKCPWNQTIQSNEITSFSSFFCFWIKSKMQTFVFMDVMLLPWSHVVLYCTIADCLSYLTACQSRALSAAANMLVVGKDLCAFTLLHL